MPRVALTSDELTLMRDRLCAAALDLVREKGIDAVSFRSLAEALGISHTLPYRYFESKDALLASVRLLCLQRFEVFVRGREPTAAPVLDRVMAVIDSFVRFVELHPVEYTLIFASQQPPPVRYPDLLAARRSLFEHCVDLVQIAVDEGLVQGEPRQIAHAIWASVHGYLSLHVANQLVHGYALDALMHPTIYRILGVSADVASAKKLPSQAPAKSSTAASKRLKPVSAALGSKRRSKSI